MDNRYVDKPTDTSKNGRLYAPHYEEAFLPIDKKTPPLQSIFSKGTHEDKGCLPKACLIVMKGNLTLTAVTPSQPSKRHPDAEPMVFSNFAEAREVHRIPSRS